MNRISPSYWLYPADLKEAISAQKEMAEKVITEDLFDSLEYVAGMDVSNNIKDVEQMIYASCVVLSKGGDRVDESTYAYKQTFPYISGFLGFREAPALVKAFEKLKVIPQMIFVDGHGISHPRQLGIASHIGVLLDIPTIGVAKTILVGKPEGVLGEEEGSTIPLVWKGKIIGAMLRTKPKVNPLIISCGHRVSLSTAIHLVREFKRKHKLPEPTRQAHILANKFRTSFIPILNK